MVSATTIGKLKIQDDGDTNWGPTTEANLNRLEEMIASEVEVTSTGGAVSLTNTDYLANQTRRAVIRCTGSLGSNLQITAPVPGSAKIYVISNRTTNNGFTTELRFGSGAYLTIPFGSVAFVLGLPDGTSHFITPPVFAGGTGVVRIDSDPAGRTGAISRAFVEDRVTILLDKDLSTPPGSPSEGDTYFIAGTGTGLWATFDGMIARWTEVGSPGWIISDLPEEGLLAWVVDEGKLYVSDGGSLTDLVGAGGIADGAVTAAKLASNAVTTAKILDANVTEAKLGSNSVALAKLKSDVYASETEAKTQTNTTKIVTPDKIKHAAFPAGTVMIFRQTAAPTGWTKITTTINNSALRVVTGTPSDSLAGLSFTAAFDSARSLSGSVGNTTLTIAQMPLHGHPYRVSVASNSNSQGTGGFEMNPNAAANQTAFTGTLSDTVGEQIGGTGGGSSHTHSLSMNSLAMNVNYIDVIAATKDSP